MTIARVGRHEVSLLELEREKNLGGRGDRENQVAVIVSVAQKADVTEALYLALHSRQSPWPMLDSSDSCGR